MTGQTTVRVVTGEPGCGRTRYLDRAARTFTAGPVVHLRADPASPSEPYGDAHSLLRALADLTGRPPAAITSAASARTALLEALRAASSRTPVLVCVDDAHLWDPVSRAALGGAARLVRAAGTGSREGTGPVGRDRAAERLSRSAGVPLGGSASASPSRSAGVPLSGSASASPSRSASASPSRSAPASPSPSASAPLSRPAPVFLSLLLAAPGHVPLDPDFAGLPLLHLEPLTPVEAAALLDTVTDAGVDPAVRDVLVDEAEGSPALLLALARALSPGQLRGHRPLPRPVAEAGVLRGLVGGCLGGLTRAQEDVLLTVAAALRVSADGAAPVGPVLRALARLTGDGVAPGLDPPPGPLVVAEGRVRFRSGLLRRAVYAGADGERRRAVHLALERAEHGLPALLHRSWSRPTPEAGTVSELAAAATAPAPHHLRYTALARAAELADQGPDRTRYTTAAAEQALLAGHPRRALRLLDTALDSTAPTPLQGRAHQLRGTALLHDGPVDEAHATLLHATTLLASGTPDRARTAALAAADAAWASGDVPGCLRALDPTTMPPPAAPAPPAPLEADRRDTPAGTPGRVAVGAAGVGGPDVLESHCLGMRALLEGRFGVAVGWLRRVVEGVEPWGEPEALVRAAAAALLMGDLDAARRNAAGALVAARTCGTVSAVAPALEYLAYTELRAGRHVLARARAEEGLRAAHRAGQRNIAAHHHAALALAASIDGNAEAVARHVRAALDIARGHGLAQAATLAEWAAARAALGAGRPAEAADRLGPLVRPGPGRGHFAVWTLAVPCHVEAAVRAGRREGLGAIVEEFAGWARFGADPQAPAQLLRCRALLAPPDGADPHFRRALDLHERVGGDFERARTELLHGQWLRRRRRLREARERLGAALVGFERCGARAWAEQTRAELRANGAPAGGAGAGDLTALTPQQLRIVRHVARGATNREVAQALTVSTRTVDYHLRKVFAALGVRSRVELARLVEQTEKTPAHP
ncbi:LuxR C-terminal-related transcriptional regulator [Streptomyces sp. NPDC018693]|uniref:helix-turn-helix transcriptional regulator n=1 Tax=unclassified Streptomyces TaxID=2593676 RepID=UPI00378E492E